MSKKFLPFSRILFIMLFGAILVFFRYPVLSFSGSPQVEKITQNFQAKLDEIHAQFKFPGATAAFVLPDGQSSALAVGFSDVENKTKMNPFDRMPSGSVGKTFVAAVMITLAKEGKLSLDDKIEKWFNKESWLPRLPNAGEITIRMLLNHRSGLIDHALESKKFAEDILALALQNPDGVFAPEKLVSYVLDSPPLFPAGTKFHYSDTNYILAGMIIEKATQSTYYRELEKRILDKFHLDNTLPAVGRKLPGIVPGYIDPKNPFGIQLAKTIQDGLLLANPQNEWTGGGLVSTPVDLALWAKRLYEGKLIKKPYLDELLDCGTFPYGLGVRVQQTDMGPMVGHSGYYPGYNTIMAYFPSHKIALAVQINQDYGHGDLKELILALAHVVVNGLSEKMAINPCSGI